MVAATSSVLSRQGDLRAWQEQFYKDLHSHPELSHQEERTAGLVAERLRQCGFQVSSGVGGTGVVGVLARGQGPTVLLRADMDALPVEETTGLPYASTVEASGPDGNDVPVMHACGHDMHVACLLGAADLLASAREQWQGNLVALFQPAEETGDGARGMVEDGLASLFPKPDVAFAQHILPWAAGEIGTRVGPALSAADSIRVTVFGRGGHGSMPQATVDPVVLAAMIVVRLQTIVSRVTPPSETAVLTVGSIQAGTKSNVIPDHAVMLLNIRTYSDRTRHIVLDAIRRIVVAECQASGSPKDAEFEMFDQFPLTTNDAKTTQRLAAAFRSHFGDAAHVMPQQTASEDFSDIPTALGTPYSYWGVGCIDAERYRAAVKAGRVGQDIPVNHAANFAPVMQPTLDVGTQAMVVAALTWLGAG